MSSFLTVVVYLEFGIMVLLSIVEYLNPSVAKYTSEKHIWKYLFYFSVLVLVLYLVETLRK